MALSTPRHVPQGHREFDARNPAASPLGGFYLPNLPDPGIEPDSTEPFPAEVATTFQE